MVEVPGSILTGVAFYCWIFCFHVVKPLTSILPLIPILCVFEKLEWETRPQETVSPVHAILC